MVKPHSSRAGEYHVSFQGHVPPNKRHAKQRWEYVSGRRKLHLKTIRNCRPWRDRLLSTTGRFSPSLILLLAAENLKDFEVFKVAGCSESFPSGRRKGIFFGDLDVPGRAIGKGAPL
jgi:hypothetical protein